MSIAFFDSSVIAAYALGEEGADQLFEVLDGFERWLASELLESEVACAAYREGVGLPDRLLRDLDWVRPTRRLTLYIERVLEAGYLRGADCHHLAVALYVAGDPAEVTFLTLDDRQRSVAAKLGFRT